jgi:hypothetical protein
VTTSERKTSDFYHFAPTEQHQENQA